MKRFLILTFSIALLSACGAVAGTRRESASESKTVSDVSEKETKTATLRPPAVGDVVVARWAGNSWYEGRIESIEGQRAKITWRDDSSASEVDIIDIYPLPERGTQAAVKKGDFVLTKRSSGADWVGAEVTMTSPGVITVRYSSDFEEANLPPERVVGVSAAVAADLRDEASRTDFLKRAQAHRPQAPADYRPKVGDRILGAWTTNAWYGGRVRSVNGSKATIAWDGPSPDEATFDNLVPYPTAENAQTPAAGDYVLVKPGSGSWDYAQVTSVNGSGVEVKDAYGKSRAVRRGEFVILK